MTKVPNIADGKGVVVKSGNSYSGFIKAGLVIGGSTLAWFLLVRPTLEWFEVIDTKAERKIRKMDAFNPLYYKEHLTKTTISTAMAQKLAKDVWLSYGINRGANTIATNPTAMGLLIGGLSALNDDEKLLVQAIGSAGSKYNISKVSDVFQRTYNKSMPDFIYDFAGNSAVEEIYKIAKRG